MYACVRERERERARRMRKNDGKSIDLYMLSITTQLETMKK